jgi:hypothetical protein
VGQILLLLAAKIFGPPSFVAATVERHERSPLNWPGQARLPRFQQKGGRLCSSAVLLGHRISTTVVLSSVIFNCVNYLESVRDSL